MTDLETISWIFLATALASQEGAANVASISMLADGINHAVPTQQEMQKSLKWLMTQELIRKDGKKYCLTDQGQELMQKTSIKSNLLLKMWEILEKDLRRLTKNNIA